MIDTTALLEKHRTHAWQPFTQMKVAGDPVVITKGEGAAVFTPEGRRIIDAVGSWWVSVHGHNHPLLLERVQQQLRGLDHVMYAGFTHPAAVQLSERLAEKTKGTLPRIFFSDNGSTAVEIALKMAFQFHSNAGRVEKKKFVTLDNGYHGDTIGTMSVGARSIFHRMYEPLLFPVLRVPPPDFHIESREDGEVARVDIQHSIDHIRRLFELESKNISAFILEPLIQGAGGMRMHHPLFLAELRKLCDAFDIFLIADEVFTGCGRTGTFLAFEKAGVWPDIAALSKGLSAGICAFAATLASEKIYQGFYSDDRTKTLFHGHSMTASPLGCAAALGSLDLLDAGGLEEVGHLEKKMAVHLAQLQSSPLSNRIKDVRWLGAVGVVEFDISDSILGDFGPRFARAALASNVLLRPLGPVVYITPPYNISSGDLDQVFHAVEKSASSVLEGSAAR